MLGTWAAAEWAVRFGGRYAFGRTQAPSGAAEDLMLAVGGQLRPRRDDQIHGEHRLEPHHADQRAVGLLPPELDAGGELTVEFVKRHV